MSYRTTPPPANATATELLHWSLAEAAAWPLNTPEFYYTYWLRLIERQGTPQATKVPKPKKDTPAPAAVQLELF
jgi:hypothetical protein